MTRPRNAGTHDISPSLEEPRGASAAPTERSGRTRARPAFRLDRWWAHLRSLGFTAPTLDLPLGGASRAPSNRCRKGAADRRRTVDRPSSSMGTSHHSTTVRPHARSLARLLGTLFTSGHGSARRGRTPDPDQPSSHQGGSASGMYLLT